MDYKQSGVDIDAGNEVVRRIRSLARGTFTPGVLSEIGSFGGLFRLGDAGGDDPVLVASADGVGTKLRVAFMTGVHTTIGVDLVNHCVNDILVQGAEPLFFLDYLATGRLDPGRRRADCRGARGAPAAPTAARCLAARPPRCPASTPTASTTSPGSSSASFRARAPDRRQAHRAGDVLIGLPSSGLHTNGYSLARRIAFDDRRAVARTPSSRRSARSIGEALLAPHRSYLSVVRPLLGHAARHQRHGPHHRRRHHRQPAAHAARRHARARSIARRGRCRRSSSGCSRQAACRTPTCCGRSTWASGSSSPARRTASAS